MIWIRTSLTLLVWSLLFLFASPPALSQVVPKATYGKRFALVIGNKDYKRGPLDNPTNDAFVIDAVLRQLGFSVALRYNLNRRDMNTELAALADRGKGAEAVLVYFSGHGVQHVGKNYLLPVDIVLNEPRSIPETTVSVDRALETIKTAGASANILILDACRDTPFENGRTRSIVSGLGEVEPGRGTLIAFSTAPGEVAGDGRAGQNSVFTDALVKSLAQENRSAESVFKRVREMVAATTNRRQIPWLNSGITGDFIFNKGTAITLPKLPEAADLLSMREKTRDATKPTASRQVTRWTTTLTPDEWAKIDGEIEERAKGVAQDDLSELTGRAYDGEAKAQVILGDAYLAGIRSGTGWIRSNKDAMQWYRRAAAEGYPLAQVRIGEMFLESRGTDRNVAEAKKWFDLAAAQGLKRAKVKLLQLGPGGATEPPGEKVKPREIAQVVPRILESEKQPQKSELQKQLVPMTTVLGRDKLVEALRNGDMQTISLYAATPTNVNATDLYAMADAARKNLQVRNILKQGSLLESTRQSCSSDAVWAKIDIQDAQLFADLCGRSVMIAALQRIINEDAKGQRNVETANQDSAASVRKCTVERLRISPGEYLQVASGVGSDILFRRLEPVELLAVQFSQAITDGEAKKQGTKPLLQALALKACTAEFGKPEAIPSQIAVRAKQLMAALKTSK